MSFATFADTSFDFAGNSWTVDLELKGGSSQSNDLKVLSGVRRVGDKRLNPLNPFIGSFLDLRVYDDGRVIYGKIKNNPPKDIRVTAKKNGTIWHRGLLKELNNGDEIRRSNPVLDLTFNDGLPYTKDVEWGDEQQRVELLTLLHHILTDNTRTSFPTRVALAFQDTEADTSSGRSRAFTHDLRYQSEPNRYWNVLSQTLRYYNLQVFQEGGKWRVLQRSYRDPGQSYDYEEKDSGGMITTGSRNPTVSFSDSSWLKKQGGTPVRRPFTRPIGWKAEHTPIRGGWQNPDFELDVSLTINGTTEPLGWERIAGATAFDEANDRIEIDAGDKVTTRYEQTYDQVLVETSNDSDSLDIQFKGEIVVLDTGETGPISVGIAQLIALDPDTGTRKYYSNISNGWGNSSSNRIKAVVQESDSGTQTRSFDETVSITPPDTGEWLIQVVLVAASADPDSDQNLEIDKTRWDKVQAKYFQRNVIENRWPYSGVSVLTKQIPDKTRESFAIGNAITTDQNGGLLPRMGLLFEDGRVNELNPLHWDSGAKHASRSVGGGNTVGLNALRLKDRHKQTSNSLFAIFGLVRDADINLRDTIKYDGRDWVPIFMRESMGSPMVRVGVIELRNDALPSDPLRIERQK